MTSTHPPMDTARRFVRVSGERPNGFVEFEFAIGEPEIFVEMILGREAFAEFCAANRVEMLPPRDPDAPQGDWDWRLADATHTRFK
ncbi:phenol hydroxylase subunit [Zoogloea sp. LCSB751]|uniref:phenol hydroxylase subunit n=1 Tax=Zoogloea sp. LCSB751 TaxID=1965277 RepID=UPI0009A55A03|nr:phenol hydroxylase subunit [Zoogloea sp. LCSB751]